MNWLSETKKNNGVSLYAKKFEGTKNLTVTLFKMMNELVQRTQCLGSSPLCFSELPRQSSSVPSLNLVLFICNKIVCVSNIQFCQVQRKVFYRDYLTPQISTHWGRDWGLESVRNFPKHTRLNWWSWSWISASLTLRSVLTSHAESTAGPIWWVAALLLGWSAGWLVGWLVGWLIGLHAFFNRLGAS